MEKISASKCRLNRVHDRARSAAETSHRGRSGVGSSRNTFDGRVSYRMRGRPVCGTCILGWHMLLAYAMNMQRPVKLFRNGRNQAVRIPREFELPGEDAIMRKEGEGGFGGIVPRGKVA